MKSSMIQVQDSILTDPETVSDTVGAQLGLHSSTLAYDCQDGILAPWLEQFRSKVEILWLAVCLCIAWIGLLGNTIVAVAIWRGGLGKSSNCLVFCLMIADLAQIWYYSYNFAYLDAKVRYALNRGWDWPVPITLAHFFLTIERVFYFIKNIGAYMISITTTFIVIERMIAVILLPQFTSLVTPRQVWIIEGFTLVPFLACMIFQLGQHHFLHDHSDDEIWPGGWKHGKLFDGHQQPAMFFEHDVIYYHAANTLPLLIVLVGSFCICAKIWFDSIERKKLLKKTNQRRWGQTTRLLLSICFVFVVYKLFVVVGYYMAYLEINQEIDFYLIVVNSSSHFCIYIIFNKRFRDRFTVTMQIIQKSVKKNRENLATVMKSGK